MFEFAITQRITQPRFQMEEVTSTRFWKAQNCVAPRINLTQTDCVQLAQKLHFGSLKKKKCLKNLASSGIILFWEKVGLANFLGGLKREKMFGSGIQLQNNWLIGHAFWRMFSRLPLEDTNPKFVALLTF